MSYPRNRSVEILAGVALAAVVGGTIAAAVGKTRRRDEWPPDSAPGRTARHKGFGRHAVVGRSVTINKPRAELYTYWRTFENLPAFMENVEEVRAIGPNRWRWRISAPAGQVVDLETEVVEDRENEVIAWRSTAESRIEAHGQVTFRDAPPDRGTVVEAVIAYVPPAGEIGRLVAKLFQREPQLQVRRELKRFKMLMETGEIAISHNRLNAA